MMTESLFADSTALAALCQKHHIRRLSLFGSVLKGTAGQDSDVDLLVEFEVGRKPGLLGLAGIEIELSSLLGGRRVDLRTAQDLSPHFRGEVVRSAEIQYGERRTVRDAILSGYRDLADGAIFVSTGDFQGDMQVLAEKEAGSWR